LASSAAVDPPFEVQWATFTLHIKAKVARYPISPPDGAFADAS